MFYNIIVDTKLRKANEFFIYDTPDINLSFQDKRFRAYYTATTAAVPKNILLEKPFGSALTAEEQQIIDDAGGLNKTVGKGFKFHIKNFNHPLYESGGSFVLLYNMQIVNPSQSLDDDQNPLYYNTASYYAQEIPTCNPEVDQICTPIKSEKAELEDIVRGKYTTKAVVKEGQIGGTVDEYTLIDITKQDDQNQPLAGAIFTIYQSDSEGIKGDVAVNKEGIRLENLVSNSEGKLSFKEDEDKLQPVPLNLKRGYYIVSENDAPDGYKKADDYFFTVGMKVDPINIKNIPETPIEPTETEPTMTEPTKTEPTVTEPTKTEPTVIEPTETEPTMTEPTKTEPTVAKPIETKPSESKSTDSKPSETEPTKPTSTKSENYPKTGEVSGFHIWVTITLIAVGVVLLIFRKRMLRKI